MWENIGVEEVVCLDRRLGAAEMFWADTGTWARGTKGVELTDGTYMCHTTRLGKQEKVAGTLRKRGTLLVKETEVRDYGTYCFGRGLRVERRRQWWHECGELGRGWRNVFCSQLCVYKGHRWRCWKNKDPSYSWPSYPILRQSTTHLAILCNTHIIFGWQIVPPCARTNLNYSSQVLSIWFISNLNLPKTIPRMLLNIPFSTDIMGNLLPQFISTR